VVGVAGFLFLLYLGLQVASFLLWLAPLALVITITWRLGRLRFVHMAFVWALAAMLNGIWVWALLNTRLPVLIESLLAVAFVGGTTDKFGHMLEFTPGDMAGIAYLLAGVSAWGAGYILLGVIVARIFDKRSDRIRAFKIMGTVLLIGLSVLAWKVFPIALLPAAFIPGALYAVGDPLEVFEMDRLMITVGSAVYVRPTVLDRALRRKSWMKVEVSSIRHTVTVKGMELSLGNPLMSRDLPYYPVAPVVEAGILTLGDIETEAM
jgi:hypothetical protein